MPGLKFRVLLDSLTDKEVFRDIIVNDSDNYETLYRTITEAFGLSNDEMASFFVSDHEWNKGKEITLMDMSFGDEEEVPEIMSENIIRYHLESPKQRYILVYDFLNMWIFLLEIQEILSNDVDAPQIVLSVGEVPSEILEKSAANLDKLSFNTELNDSEFGDMDMGDYDDGFSEEDFDNIDDYEL